MFVFAVHVARLIICGCGVECGRGCETKETPCWLSSTSRLSFVQRTTSSRLGPQQEVVAGTSSSKGVPYVACAMDACCAVPCRACRAVLVGVHLVLVYLLLTFDVCMCVTPLITRAGVSPTIQADLALADTKTGASLREQDVLHSGRVRRTASTFLHVRNVTKHNLHNVSVRFPREVLTCVTGVAGSGKSTLTFHGLLAQFPEAVCAAGRSAEWLPVVFMWSASTNVMRDVRVSVRVACVCVLCVVCAGRRRSSTLGSQLSFHPSHIHWRLDADSCCVCQNHWPQSGRLQLQLHRRVYHLPWRGCVEGGDVFPRNRHHDLPSVRWGPIHTGDTCTQVRQSALCIVCILSFRSVCVCLCRCFGRAFTPGCCVVSGVAGTTANRLLTSCT